MIYSFTFIMITKAYTTLYIERTVVKILRVMDGSFNHDKYNIDIKDRTS